MKKLLRYKWNIYCFTFCTIVIILYSLEKPGHVRTNISEKSGVKMQTLIDQLRTNNLKNHGNSNDFPTLVLSAASEKTNNSKQQECDLLGSFLEHYQFQRLEARNNSIKLFIKGEEAVRFILKNLMTKTESYPIRIKVQYPSYNVAFPKHPTKEDREIFENTVQNNYRYFSRNQQTSHHVEGWLEVTKNKDANGVKSHTDNQSSQFKGKSLQKLLVLSTPDLKSCSSIVLPSPTSKNLVDFVLEVFPHLLQLPPALQESSNIFIASNTFSAGQIPFTQQFLGKAELEVLKENELSEPQYIVQSISAPTYHPLIWSKIRRMLNVSQKLSVPVEEAYVVFMMKPFAEDTNLHMLNKFEVRYLLYTRYGQQLRDYLPASNYTEGERRDLLSKARLVIGLRTEAFFNSMIYCPQETVFIEYNSVKNGSRFDSNAENQTEFWKLASAMSQTYYQINEASQTQYGSIEVNTEKLSEVLDEIDLDQGVESQAYILNLYD